MTILSHYIVIALAFVPRSLQAKDPIKDFCRRWGHAAAVVDRKLYIDGGYINWNPLSQNGDNYTNMDLIYHNLDQVKNDMPAPYALSKASTVPSVIGGALWADNVNKVIYQYGGQFVDAARDFDTMFAYDTLLNTWNETAVKSAYRQRPAWGASTVAEDQGYAYYLGGWMSSNSTLGYTDQPRASNRLIRFDMNNGEFSNVGTIPGGKGRAEGALLYIPASDSGLLVYFGGVETPYDNSTVMGVDMRSITIYDTSSRNWHIQNATGDIPEMRSRFCAGVTWAQDQSSYNIYIYGGASTSSSTAAFDDVYILSLPSFTWIKWFPFDSDPRSPHHSLTCNVISGSQMLIIGGNFPTLPDYCDVPDQLGQHNLVLGENGPRTVKWDWFSPSLTQYAVPTAVIAKIGGGATGGATLKGPQTWAEKDLSTYFARKATFSALSPTRSIPTSSAPTRSVPTATGSPKSKKKSASRLGPILGGVLGGLVVLGIVLVCILCCLRRKKRHTVPVAISTEDNGRVHSAPAELHAVSLSEMGDGRELIPSQEIKNIQSSPPAIYPVTSVQHHSPTNSGSPLPSPRVVPAAYETSPHHSNDLQYQQHLPSQAFFNETMSPLSANPFLVGGIAQGQHTQNITQSYTPRHSPQSSFPQPYNPALDPLRHEHFPPPRPGSTTLSNQAPTQTPSATTDDMHPPSQTNTPANFYPAQYEQGSESGSRGKFVEGT